MTALRRLVNVSVLTVVGTIGGFVVMGWWAHGGELHTHLDGDEPHYVVVAQSLATDGDLDVRDDYRNGVVRRLVGGELPSAGQVKPASTGAPLRSYREPLLPLLLVPALAISGTVASFRWTMIVIGALAMGQLVALLGDVSASRRRANGGGRSGDAPRRVWSRGAVGPAATLALVAIGVGISLPVVAYGTQVYPEIPAMLALSIALRGWLRLRRRSRGPLVGDDQGAGDSNVLQSAQRCALGSTVALAALPWLHGRFDVLAAGVAAVVSWDLYIIVRPHRASCRACLRPIVVALSPLIVAVIVRTGLHWHLYGSPWPTAQYDEVVGWSLHRTWQVAMGQWLDGTAGLLPYGPFLWLGLIGMGVAIWRCRGRGLVLLAAAGAYAFFIVPRAYFGLSMPGRFAIVLVPFLAVSALWVIEAVPVLAVVGFALIIASGALTREGRAFPFALLDVGAPRLPLITKTASAFPFMHDLPGLDAVSLPVATATRLDASVGAEGRVILTEAGAVVEYERVLLRDGPYQASIDLTPIGVTRDATTGSTPLDQPVAEIEVTRLPQGWLLARRTVWLSELDGDVALDFIGPARRLDGPSDFARIGVRAVGSQPVSVGDARVALSAPVADVDEALRDTTPLGLLWLGTTAVSTLAATSAARERRRGRETLGRPPVSRSGSLPS